MMLPNFLALVLLCGIITASASAEVALPQSAYDIMSSFNFPIGLLPVGSTGFDFNPKSGNFAVYFDGECKFSLEGSYQIKYQPKITGRISDGKLTDLNGVSVKFLLFWVNIIEVDRIGGNLEFSIGVASADFPVENFYESPRCGCGVDCVNLIASI